MLKLEILPRKTFELTLANGDKVQGQFGTWSVSRFGEKRNLGLAAVFEFFASDKFQLKDMIDFIMCAIEYKERQNKQPVGRFTDVDFCVWMDDYMQESGETGVLTKIYQVSSSEDTTDKKKQDDQPSGVISSEPTVQQEGI